MNKVYNFFDQIWDFVVVGFGGIGAILTSNYEILSALVLMTMYIKFKTADIRVHISGENDDS